MDFVVAKEMQKPLRKCILPIYVPAMTMQQGYLDPNYFDFTRTMLKKKLKEKQRLIIINPDFF